MGQACNTLVYGATDSGFSTDKITLGCVDCDLIGDRMFGVSQGLTGDRQELACKAAILGETVSGGFNIKPTPAEFDWILDRAIGSNTGTPWLIGTTLPSYHLWIKKGGLQTFLYAGLRTNRLIISGNELDFLNVRVDTMGQAETEVSDPSSPAALDCAATFAFSTIVLTIGGTAFLLKSFQLTIDNRIQAQQQENNATRQIFEAGRLGVSLNVTCGYRSDTKALYRKGIAGDDNCTLAITNGTSTYTFSFGNLKIPTSGPKVPADGEVTMDLTMNSYKSTNGTYPQLKIVKV